MAEAGIVYHDGKKRQGILAGIKICQSTTRTTLYDFVFMENDNVVRYIAL